MGKSSTLESGGRNQRWPTSGPAGYTTAAASGGAQRFKAGDTMRGGPQVSPWLHKPWRVGVPTASVRGTKAEVAHKWAGWLHNPCRQGGSGTLQRGGHNRKRPTMGSCGYITPTASGNPQHFTAQGDSRKWPTTRPGDYITPAAWASSQRFRAGDTIISGQQVGQVDISLAAYGVPNAGHCCFRPLL